jgi:hypothetical protein
MASKHFGAWSDRVQLRSIGEGPADSEVYYCVAHADEVCAWLLFTVLAGKRVWGTGSPCQVPVGPGSIRR